MTAVPPPALTTGDSPRLPLPAFVWRLLTLRLTRDQFAQTSRHHFLLGILSVWIVGMGRWWDDPTANILQHLGLGSVVYVFILAGAIWLIFLPLRPARWRYAEILTVITLTSFPGIFYAIPVEKFTPPNVAVTLNVTLLAIVATWRMAIIWTFLRRYAQLSPAGAAAGLAFPFFSLLTVLAFLQALNEALRVMGGVRPRQEFGLASLTDLFAFAALGSFIGFIYMIIRTNARHRQSPAPV